MRATIFKLPESFLYNFAFKTHQPTKVIKKEEDRINLDKDKVYNLI